MLRVGTPRSRNKEHPLRGLASLTERDEQPRESFHVGDTSKKRLTT